MQCVIGDSLVDCCRVFDEVYEMPDLVQHERPVQYSRRFECGYLRASTGHGGRQSSASY